MAKFEYIFIWLGHWEPNKELYAPLKAIFSLGHENRHIAQSNIAITTLQEDESADFVIAKMLLFWNFVTFYKKHQNLKIQVQKPNLHASISVCLYFYP